MTCRDYDYIKEQLKGDHENLDLSVRPETVLVI